MLTELYTSQENFQRIPSQLDKDNALFREKYIVTNVLHNSANGIIYEGVTRENLTQVCFKQVARRSVTDVVHYNGHKMPVEFYRHKVCSHLDGVVKVRFLINW